MERLEAIKRTAGLGNGMRTVDEVSALFGVNVRLFPELFSVNCHQLVSRLPVHEMLYQKHLEEHKALGIRLGIK